MGVSDQRENTLTELQNSKLQVVSLCYVKDIIRRLTYGLKQLKEDALSVL